MASLSIAEIFSTVYHNYIASQMFSCSVYEFVTAQLYYTGSVVTFISLSQLYIYDHRLVRFIYLFITISRIAQSL